MKIKNDYMYVVRTYVHNKEACMKIMMHILNLFEWILWQFHSIVYTVTTHALSYQTQTKIERKTFEKMIRFSWE